MILLVLCGLVLNEDVGVSVVLVSWMVFVVFESWVTVNVCYKP